MRRMLSASLAALLSLCTIAAAQTGGSPATASSAGAKTAKKRGPIFRATKDQIKQAQELLKQRGFYSGEATGKLDAETRAGVKKYQQAEGIKVTGTLNRVTLEKMNVALTDRQRTM